MSTKRKNRLRELMLLAWQFARQSGQNFSDCLRKAWLNIKLKDALFKGIVRFYFQKVDGTIREAWGTLEADRMPEISGTDRRLKNNTVQVYYDTERQEFRCFKKINLIG